MSAWVEGSAVATGQGRFLAGEVALRVTLVSADLPLAGGGAGGVATFVRHLSRMLSEAGEQVRVMWTGGPRGRPLDPQWLASCGELGITIERVLEPEGSRVFPKFRPLRMAEATAAHLHDADVVYLSDWSNMGFHALRSRRFRAASGPTFVTVLHGASAWMREGEERHPDLRDLNLAFMEEYSARHSDFVFSPSRYMLDWVRRAGWMLPADDRLDVLGLPHPGPFASSLPGWADRYRRIVFFGRQETRKGIELFVDGLALLAGRDPERLRPIEEVVLLGDEALHGRRSRSRLEGEGGAAGALRQSGLHVTALAGLDSAAAQRYLAEHASDSLVLVPSPADNLPYAAIEASLIPGLHLLCSSGGGIPEVLGPGGAGQLFRPDAASLAAAVGRWIERGPAKAGELARYDWQAANRRWISAHERVCAHARPRASAPAAAAITGGPGAVDVCIAHFNHGRYLPDALRSFELQTSRNFHLIVTDDGSDDPASLDAFEAMRARYLSRGWDFHRQPHRDLGAARNAGARRGAATYLCFFDSDDVASPRLIERLLESIALSGDDALGCGFRQFEGDALPFDLQTGEPTGPALYCNRPLGNSLTAALADPGVLPSSVLIVRRTVLESVGGWSEAPATGHTDFELHVRLALQGFRTDVIPEDLFFRRHVPGSRWQTLNKFRARRLVLDAYQRRFDKLGLRGLAGAFQGLHEEAQALREQLRALRQELRVRPEAPQGASGPRALWGWRESMTRLLGRTRSRWRP